MSFEPGPAVTCTRTFAILPLRYAVVCGSDLQRSAVPELPAQLRRPHQVGALRDASYTVRPLREGFLYGLVRRGSTGRYVWEKHFRVEANGALSPIDPNEPWGKPPSSDAVDAIERPKWLFAIHDLDDVRELRLLYSPDPLTPAMLDKCQAEPLYRDKLTTVNVACFASETPPLFMPNTLTYTQFDVVPDFMADYEPGLEALLKSQAYTAQSLAKVTAQAAMAPTAKNPRHRGVAIVVDDAIGITQELNAWRNASMDPLDAFMAQTDSEGVGNERKCTIAYAIESVRDTLADQAEQNYRDTHSRIAVLHTGFQDPQGARRQRLLATGMVMREYRDATHQEEVMQAEIRTERERSWRHYAPFVDESMLQAFQRDYKAVVQAADEMMDARGADHLLWLQSEQLLDALALYDRGDLLQGLLFESQLGLAIVGMNATNAGAALLAAWSEQEPAAGNLFWRTLGLNQQTVEAELAGLFAQRATLARLDDDPTLGESDAQQISSGLISVFTASVDMTEALEAASTPGPPRGRLAGGAMAISTLGTRLFQNKIASAADKPIHALLVRVLQARLGSLAKHFHLQSRGGKPMSVGATRRVDRAVTADFDTALRAGIKGPMTQVRISNLVTVLEIWNLKIKLEAADKESREYLEITAALTGIAAAGLEVGATAASFVQKHGSGEIYQSGLRLAAGALVGWSAGVGAAFDVVDGRKHRSEGRVTLAALYFLRALAQIGVANLVIAIALAKSGAALEYLIERHGRRFLLRVGAAAARALAPYVIPMLRLCLGLNAFALLFTLAIIYFQPTISSVSWKGVCFAKIGVWSLLARKKNWTCLEAR